MFYEVVDSINVFMLVAARVSGVLLGLPVFSARFLPVIWRIGLCLAVSAILLPVAGDVQLSNDAAIIPALLFEILAGVLIGLGLVMVFAAVQLAGQMMDVQMGFGIVNVIDPHWEQPVPLIGNFLNLFTILVFILAEGHHHVFRSLAWSFSVVPPGTPSISGAAVSGIVDVGAWMLVTGIRLAAPVVGALLMVNLALGVMGRTMPQMNILVVGMPLKILAGFLVLLVVVPFLAPSIWRLFDHMFGVLIGLWEVIGP